jgi:hypothetical protein
MRHGAASHATNDWLTRPVEYHIGRAIEHLKLVGRRPPPRPHIARRYEALDGVDVEGDRVKPTPINVEPFRAEALANQLVEIGVRLQAIALAIRVGHRPPNSGRNR